MPMGAEGPEHMEVDNTGNPQQQSTTPGGPDADAAVAHEKVALHGHAQAEVFSHGQVGAVQTSGSCQKAEAVIAWQPTWK